MKNIKILMIGSDVNVKGGISSVVKQFLNYKWDQHIKISYIPTYIERNKLYMLIYYIKSLINILIKLCCDNIDIIHIHMSHTGSFYRKYIIFKISKLFNKKVIIHLHGSEFEKFFIKSGKVSKNMIKDMIKNSDKFLVLGKNWDEIINRIEPKANTEILLNTINIPKEIVKYNKNEVKILFLGSLVRRKGIFELVEVINILKNKGICDKYSLKFIIGGTGKEEQNLKQNINRYRLDSYIDLVGWVDGEKKKELLKSSQVFILPSHNEGLPIAILEAISYGLPVISTNVGSINEAVVEDYNGILIEPCNVNQLENAICKILSSESIWNQFSKNSRKIAENKFDEESYFLKIESLYKNLTISSEEKK